MPAAGRRELPLSSAERRDRANTVNTCTEEEYVFAD